MPFVTDMVKGSTVPVITCHKVHPVMIIIGVAGQKLYDYWFYPYTEKQLNWKYLQNRWDVRASHMIEEVMSQQRGCITWFFLSSSFLEFFQLLYTTKRNFVKKTFIVANYAQQEESISSDQSASCCSFLTKSKQNSSLSAFMLQLKTLIKHASWAWLCLSQC